MKSFPHRPFLFLLAALAVLLGGVALRPVLAQGEQPLPPDTPAGSPLHPTFPLLDEDGENVLESGAPISTMATCGDCHDTAFIATHSFHADAGLSQVGQQEGLSHSWDNSPGLYGDWNPLTYRLLAPAGEGGAALADLTIPDWIRLFGARHPGGGPAVYTPDGERLDAAGGATLASATVDPETGELVPWDWQESGVVEMNCFLCHTAAPDNDARLAELSAGRFAWANTATLAGSGIVTGTAGGWQYEREAFDEAGNLLPAYITVQDPTDENCGACHGLVHSDARDPLAADFFTAPYLDGTTWSTRTTGQLFSPQRLASTGLNLSGKQSLSRSWDIHAERVVGCTDCHYSLNNPIYYRPDEAAQPDHLTFDPRRIDIGEYLLRPVHEFAKGQSAQSALAPQFDNSLRRCESCHSVENTHDWLPYKERHTTALSCETCHVPRLYAPAQEAVDWTVLDETGAPLSSWRGVEPVAGSATDLITGYRPVLLPRENGDGTTSLAPHNLISAWYWVYGDPARPVPLRLLQEAWLDGDSHAPEIIAAFDADGDGRLAAGELRIDGEEKEAAVAARLESLGLEQPRIVGEVQPYSISHNVATGDWAIDDCQSCHSGESMITAPMQLASYIPGGAMPTILAGNGATFRGELVVGEDGALTYEPSTRKTSEDGAESIYVLGHDNLSWVDWFGAIAFAGTLLGVAGHGGLRFFALRRQAKAAHEPELQRVYMYGVYERFWHWLQTLVILGLLFTGLIIHKPDMFGIFSFRYVVLVHNVLAAILVVNAALSAFYHLASGEIQQFIPRPRGFFDQAFEQAKFYLGGIFRGGEHPFAKTRERKLNPLQQITYFGLLNVLLPLQVITGILMWGVQRWPDTAALAGGLPGLAPFHTLISWLLAAFVVMHVYLTTTGHTATANIKAMIMGWDEVETAVQPQPQEAAS